MPPQNCRLRESVQTTVGQAEQRAEVDEGRTMMGYDGLRWETMTELLWPCARREEGNGRKGGESGRQE